MCVGGEGVCMCVCGRIQGKIITVNWPEVPFPLPLPQGKDTHTHTAHLQKSPVNTCVCMCVGVW